MNSKRSHGEGSIGQLADGRFQARVSVGIGTSGKRLRKAFYGATRKEVAEKMTSFNRLHAGAKWVEPTAMTVQNLAMDWLDNRHSNKSPTTKARREVIVRLHILPNLGMVKLQQLRPLHIQRMIDKLRPKGAWTQKMAYDCVHTIIAYAIRMQYLGSNPAAAIDPPKPDQKKPAIFSDDEIKKILEASKGRRLHALFVLAACTGMRQGELLGLSWPEVDLVAGLVHVRKSLAEVRGKFTLKDPKSKAGQRSINIPEFAIGALADHKKAMLKEGRDLRKGPVFVSRKGTFIQKSNLIRYVWDLLIEEAGVTRRPFQALRHSHASCLLRNGTNIRAVAERMGHSDPAMTLRVYAHVLPAEDNKLALLLQSLLA